MHHQKSDLPSEIAEHVAHIHCSLPYSWQTSPINSTFSSSSHSWDCWILLNTALQAAITSVQTSLHTRINLVATSARKLLSFIGQSLMWELGIQTFHISIRHWTPVSLLWVRGPIKTTRTADRMVALFCGWTNRLYPYSHILLFSQKIIWRPSLKRDFLK